MGLKPHAFTQKEASYGPDFLSRVRKRGIRPAPACIHCGYPLSSAAPYADFRPITGPNRFTVRLTARPAYPDARSRTLRALMKELGLSREQGRYLLEQVRREPVPLREGLTEEEALALLEVFRRAGAPVQLVDGAVPELPQRPSPVPAMP